MQSANFSYFKKIAEDIWYISRGESGLFKKSLCTGEESLIYMPVRDGVIAASECAYDYFLKDGDEIWLFPRYEQNILVWNMRLNTSVVIPFPEKPKSNGEYFFYAFQTKDRVIVLPQSYQGIFFIEKATKKIKMDDRFYSQYLNMRKVTETEMDISIFHSSPIIKGDIIYAPFYNINKVLKYNYIMGDYVFLDTIRVGNFLEQCEDKENRILIINRRSSFLADNIQNPDWSAMEVQVMDKMTRIFLYQSKLFIFGKKKVYVYDTQKKKYMEDKWISKINETYYQRICFEEGNNIDDSLYVFIENDSLNMTYEYDNRQVVIIIHDDGMDLFEYERHTMSQEEILLAVINQRGKTIDNVRLHDNCMSSVGTDIYRNLIDGI